MPRPWEDTSREEIEGRENEVVDNYAQYCSIARTGIGSTSLIIGGEVDGGAYCLLRGNHSLILVQY